MDSGPDLADPRIIRALSHPLRARILAELEQGQASPVELSRSLGASVGTVSYHVKLLEELGLIRLVKTTPRRGAVEHHYRAQARARSSAEAWDRLPAAARGEAARQSGRALGAALEQAGAADGFRRPGAGIERVNATLDPLGWEEWVREVELLLERLRQIESRSAARLAGGAEAIEAAVAVAIIELPR